MGKFNSITITVMFSAVFGLLLGTGYLIGESYAVNDLCFGKTAAEWLANPEGHTIIIGTDKRDKITGTNGPDVIITLKGNDRVNSGNGPDIVCTGDGNDQVNSGNGDDMIDPGDNNDIVNAGNGNDMVFARDGNKDAIDCGKGNDFVQADEKERRIRNNCETVEVPYDTTSTQLSSGNSIGGGAVKDKNK